MTYCMQRLLHADIGHLSKNRHQMSSPQIGQIGFEKSNDQIRSAPHMTFWMRLVLNMYALIGGRRRCEHRWSQTWPNLHGKSETWQLMKRRSLNVVSRCVTENSYAIKSHHNRTRTGNRNPSASIVRDLLEVLSVSGWRTLSHSLCGSSPCPAAYHLVSLHK